MNKSEPPTRRSTLAVRPQGEPSGGPRGDDSGNLRTSTAKGVAWNGLERWFVRGVSTLTFIVLGRLLQPEAFGLIALATACLSFIQVLADFGFSTWLIQARRIGPREISTAFWTSFTLGSTYAILFILLASLISQLLGAPELTSILRVYGMSIVLSGLSGTPTAILTRALRFRELAVRQIVAAVTGSVVGLTVAIITQSIWALVAQQLAQQIASCIALYAISRWRPQLLFDKTIAVDIARFGSKMLTVALLQQLRDQGQNLLIGRILGPTPLGYWTVATRLVQMVKDVCLSVISTVSMPAFLRLRDDRPRLARAYESSLTSSTAVFAPCMACLAAVSPVAIPLIFGRQWEPSVPIAVIVAASGIVTPMMYFDRSIFLACSRLDIEMRFVLLVAALHLISITVVGPLGLIPLAIAVALRPLVIWPARLLTLQRVADIPFRAQRRATEVAGIAAAILALSAGIDFLVEYPIRWMALAAITIGYVGTFAILLLLTNRSLVASIASDVKRLLHKPQAGDSSLTPFGVGALPNATYHSTEPS